MQGARPTALPVSIRIAPGRRLANRWADRLGGRMGTRGRF